MAIQPRRLAMLACIARGGELGVSRDRLVATFWPDTPEEAGRRAVTQALSALRGGLEAPDFLLGTQELRLNPEVVQCDLWAFEEALSERRYERAIALYGGPFLDGFRLGNVPEFERWVEDTRRGLADRHDVALERLARAAGERADYLAAAGWWRRRLASDPLSARVTVEVMRALMAAGDSSSALAQGRVYATLAQQELGLAPDAAVVAVMDEAQRARQRPAEPAVVPAVSTETFPPAVETPATSPHAIALEAPRGAAGEPVPADPPRAARKGWIATGLVLGLAALLVFWVSGRDPEDRLQRLRVVDPVRVSFEDGLELDPAISPNGQQIAYSAGQPGAMRLMIRQGDGSRALALAPLQRGDQRRPRWSPDGSRVLYQAERAIWTVPALGGDPRLIIDAPADTSLRAEFPTLSVDGREVAYVVGDSLLVSSLDGANRRLVLTQAGLHSPAWSPDGRWLALVAGNRDFLYGVVGNLAPSALLLVPATCDATRTPCVPIVVGAPDALHLSPEWRTADQLLFVSRRGGSRDVFGVRIGNDGQVVGAPHRLTSGADAASVTVTADGTTFAYSVLRVSANVWSTSLTNPSTPVQVTKGTQIVEGVDVTPDGRWLTFDADRTGQQDIFVLPVNDGMPTSNDATQLVDAPLDDFHPTWSRDGQWLTYYTFRDGLRRAAVVSIKGGAPQIVLPNSIQAEEYSPVWAHDDRAILYWRYLDGRFQLFELPRQGPRAFGTERQLTQRGGYGPSFTRDGRMAYFSAPGEMWLMPANRLETQAVQIYPPLRGARPTLTVTSGRISPDGTMLIVKATDEQGDGYWTIPVAGGAPRLEFASDGRHLFFTYTERLADVWSAKFIPQ
jgi:Tol biopolymer transport system component/DNA-binding SARP family transcriptional activator